MLRIRQESPRSLGVYTEQGTPIFSVSVELPAYEVRSFCAEGKGNLRAIFLGSDAYDEACAWMEDHRPRLGPRRAQDTLWADSTRKKAG